MRTKTLALSAMVGLLGSAAAMATNVYSVNAVGYINVVMQPGFNIITCPLICGTDPGNPTVTNDLNVLFPNPAATAPYFNPSVGSQGSGAIVYQMSGGVYTAIDTAQSISYGGGWASGGADITVLPGQAVFFQNPNPIGGANMTATFVGTVPQGTMTNVLTPGYNLVGSMVPVSGDLVTNSISLLSTVDGPYPAAQGDFIYFFNPGRAGSTQNQIGFQEDLYSYGAWFSSSVGPNIGPSPNYDPITVSVYQGFFYNNGQGANEKWVETFSVNP
jgi:hypothetical protein